jgi:hypothetical protein
MFKGMNEKKRMYGFAAMALVFILVMAPSINFASATTTTTTTGTRTEQQQQMEATQALTTQQLTSDEQNVGNIQFNIRWGDVQFIQPENIAILFADCNVGEFAVTGLKMFGSADIGLLEDYPFALPGNTMTWLTVVRNTAGNEVTPASIGVICVNGIGDTATGTSLSDDTKIRIRNAINIAINSGDINIFQIQQVFQSIVQNVIIANNTLGPNATINVNQTAIQNALQRATANVTEAPAPPPTSGANETQGMITGPIVPGGEEEEPGAGEQGGNETNTGADDTGADDTGADDTGADDTGADDTGADDTSNSTTDEP